MLFLQGEVQRESRLKTWLFFVESLCSIMHCPVLLKIEKIDRVVVSSDNLEILNFSKKFGANISLKRPEELATDKTHTLPVVLHALKHCESEDNVEYQIILLLQVTNPLVLPDDIEATIEKILTTRCDSCFTVTKLDHIYLTKLKRLSGDSLIPLIEIETKGLRRQDCPEVYIRNGSCYAVRRETLLSGMFFGKDSRRLSCQKNEVLKFMTRLIWS